MEPVYGQDHYHHSRIITFARESLKRIGEAGWSAV
jgi:hypothetical protein